MGQRRLLRADVLVRRALVLLAMAGFVAAVYAAVVVGIGALSGRGQPDLVLAIVATVVVAVTFERVRAASQRAASHLVGDERATPYQALSRFSAQTAGLHATDEVLPRMAKVAADGTGAASAQVWLRVGGALRLAASWPDPPAGEAQVDLAEGSPLRIPGVDELVAVRHHGELLGALAVAKPPRSHSPRSRASSSATWPPRPGWCSATSS